MAKKNVSSNKEKKNGRSDGRMEKKITYYDESGIKRRKSIYGYNGEELEKNIKEFKKSLIEAEDPMFNLVIDKWIDEHSNNIEYYTNACYKAPIKDVKAEFKDYKLAEIQPLDIQNFLNRLVAKRFSRQTVKLRLIVLKQTFCYAILHGYIKYNPTQAVKIPKTKASKKIEAPSDEQIKLIHNNVNNEFGLYAFMLLYTGCRRGELLALRYEDIINEAFVINKVIVFENGKPIVRNYTKTQSGMRNIPILKPLADILPKNKNGYIFNVDGNPLTLSQLNIRWDRYRRETEITITQHQLRHAFATICFDAGLDPKDAQDLLGHSKESVTRDIYTSIRQKRKEQTTNKLNNYLSSNLSSWYDYFLYLRYFYSTGNRVGL